MSNKICILCKSSNNLELEDTLLICTQCGIVVDEDNFTIDDKNLIKTTHLSNDYCNLIKHTNLMKKELKDLDFRTVSKKESKNILNYCSNYFKLTDCMKEESKLILIQLLNSKHFHSSTIKTKIILSGISIYLVLNKFNYAITKTTISKVIGCSVFEFGSILKRVILNTNINKPNFFTINQHILEAINNLSFNKDELPKIEDYISELINFQQRCCLIDSKFSLNIIYVSAFYSWKCLNLNERLNYKLEQFQKEFKLNCKLTYHFNRLINFLIELCYLIPWIKDKKTINRKTVYFYTEDLFTNSNSILSDYMKLKNQLIDNQINKQSIDNQINKQSIDNQINKQSTILKRERFDFNDDDDRISDSEIDSYIRTDKEVKILKKIKSQLEN